MTHLFIGPKRTVENMAKALDLQQVDWRHVYEPQHVEGYRGDIVIHLCYKTGESIKESRQFYESLHRLRGICTPIYINHFDW
jgi:hypothetical protein